MTTPEDPNGDAAADAAPAEVLVGRAADPRAEVLAEHPDSDVAAGDSAAAVPDVDAGAAAFDRGADPAS